MPVAEGLATLSPQEYLRWEARQETRHEYLGGGEVSDVGDASLPHGTVALDVATLLPSQLRRGPCRAFVAWAKVRIAPRGGPTPTAPGNG